MTTPRTLHQKLWERHVIREREDGASLLFIDRHLMHEGSRNGFESLQARGAELRRPQQSFAFADHWIPTIGQALGPKSIENADARGMVEAQVRNSKRWSFRLFGLEDDAQGIVHVVAPEQGIILPGMTVVCGDSHTSTHGAFGALAFGIGTSELIHVLATQALWQTPSKDLRINVHGQLAVGVTAKDLVLAIIQKIGTAGGTGSVIEYAGPTIDALSMEQRMTVCNMSIEAGAKAGLIAPDAKTAAYLEGRPFAPKGELWEEATRAWAELRSDEGARFDREVTIDASQVRPMLTWGTSPEDVITIDGMTPDPNDEPAGPRRDRIERALAYMGLQPRTKIAGVAVDRVFIGSCTNSRIEDLREAAKIFQGRKVSVPSTVVPGSRTVSRQAEAEGLREIFVAAGCDWREPGCSMCVGVNGDVGNPGERCLSSTNRNFEGRQGQGVRTHLVSPAMAAAAAIAGRIVDPRTIA